MTSEHDEAPGMSPGGFVTSKLDRYFFGSFGGFFLRSAISRS